MKDLENNFEISMEKQEMFYINFHDHISNTYERYRNFIGLIDINKHYCRQSIITKRNT